MKNDCINSTLIDAIASLAKQTQCDYHVLDNIIHSEEFDFYLESVKEGLETIRTLVDMVLKDNSAANKTKKGGET